MNLTEQVSQFIANPFPLWETTLTRHLVQHQWEELSAKGFISFEQYSIAGIWLNQPELETPTRIKVPESCFYAEMPSPLLNAFYQEHGLDLLSDKEIEENNAIAKIEKALCILKLVKPAYNCVCELVKSIHVLEQPDDEIDLSYSHPQIPFSIFISVCNDDSMISNLRIAESILHEAMHLKLTLIESIIPLVKPNTEAMFYSPWREEERPVRGVLHGLFVFRAILDLYKFLLTEALASSNQESDFVKYRIEAIHYELQLLTDFQKSEGLTHFGKELATDLFSLVNTH